MPYKNPEKQREAMRAAKKRYREKMKADAEFLANESERKAEWYQENKERIKAKRKEDYQKNKERELAYQAERRAKKSG